MEQQPQSTTQFQEPIVQTGGSSPVSWDELDNVTNFRTKVQAEEKKIEAAAEKEAGTKSQKSDAPKESKEESQPKETKNEKNKNIDKNDSKNDKKNLEKEEKPFKLLKLKNGDGELELRTDAMVPVKIDGKTVEVPIQEVINRYSQQSHVDQLYKDFQTQKTAFEKDRKSISEALNKSYEMLTTKKDLRGFVDYISEALGVDGNAIYSEAVQNIQKQLEEWQGLSPEERKAKQLEEENAWYRSKMDAQKQQKEELKSRSQLEQRVQKVMETHGMDNKALVQAWDDLIAIGHDPQKLDPEFVGAYHSNMKKLDMIEGQLKSINPELLNDSKAIETLMTLAIQNNANDAEIAEVIQSIYGETPEKKLAKKIQKNEHKNRTSQPKNPGKDPMFFDDLS